MNVDVSSLGTRDCVCLADSTHSTKPRMDPADGNGLLSRSARANLDRVLRCSLRSLLMLCSELGLRARWLAEPLVCAGAVFAGGRFRFAQSHRSTAAEAQYVAGQQAEEAGNPACIDYYFAAATLSWPYHVAGAATPDDRGSELYRSAVQSFIESAARFGRFNRRQGVVLASGQIGAGHVPRLRLAAGRFLHVPAGRLLRFASAVEPLCVVRRRRAVCGAFDESAAASVHELLPAICGDGRCCADRMRWAAALRCSSTIRCGQRRPTPACRWRAISRRRSPTRPRRKPTPGWRISCGPSSDDALDGLHMREPFQPGKIPVVFVHGLASDPLTWAQLENDLRRSRRSSIGTSSGSSGTTRAIRFWRAPPGCGSSSRRFGRRTIRCGAIRTCRGWCSSATAWAGCLSQMQVTYSGDMHLAGGGDAAVQHDRHRPGDAGRSGGRVFLSAVARYEPRDLHRHAASRVERGDAVRRPDQLGADRGAARVGRAARATGARQSGCISRRAAAQAFPTASTCWSRTA